MAEESTFRGVILFMEKVGIYDVVLPFLLVFTIVFAIFEKTRILGIEKIDGKEYTKKNLNSMAAFTIAFLVIASTRLVAIVNEVMANIVLLLILAISFLLLVGVFLGTGEFTLKEYPGWIKFFMIFMFLGILLIFINAFGWMDYLFKATEYWNADVASGVLFAAVLLGILYYITKDKDPKATKSKAKK